MAQHDPSWLAPYALASALVLSSAVAPRASATGASPITASVTASSPAPIQGGYTTDKYPELGLTLQRARDYEQIPTQPDEQFVVLHYGEKIPEKPKVKKAVRPEMFLIWIDFVPDLSGESPATGVPRGGDPGGGERGGGERGGSESGGDAANSPQAPIEKPKPAINSLQRWIGREMPHWKLGKPVEGKERDGYSALEYTLMPLHGARAREAGWVYAWKNARRTVAILGVCGEDELKDQVKIWRNSAEHLKITEPEEQSTANLERHYARLTFIDPEFRIGVRRKLVRGWKAEDTEHFIVVFDTPDQPLMRKVLRDIELLRNEYMKLFPPAGEMKAVSTVRVCKSRDEYFSYGGPPHTAGFWNRETEELVLYDAEQIDRNHQRSETNTFIALYHEAFHQFIHYSVGELPPHPWFNEGHGDFFSGATVRDGKVRAIGPNPWRVNVIKYAVMTQQYVHWKDMIHYEKPQYYANPDVCYAEGWSMIYFLRTSKEVAKKPEWAKILPGYFDALKANWADELHELGARGRAEDVASRLQAGLAARERAVEKAFTGVDLDEIEQAWLKFVDKLEEPERK